MAIKCCYGCVAPKRYPGCHDHCPDRIAEKAEDDRLKAIAAAKKKINNDIYNQRAIHVTKAMKKHGRIKNGRQNH